MYLNLNLLASYMYRQKRADDLHGLFIDKFTTSSMCGCHQQARGSVVDLPVAGRFDGRFVHRTLERARAVAAVSYFGLQPLNHSGCRAERALRSALPYAFATRCAWRERCRRGRGFRACVACALAVNALAPLRILWIAVTPFRVMINVG